jgi:hypothetical protein
MLRPRLTWLAILPALFLLWFAPACGGQGQSPAPPPAVPDVPKPQTPPPAAAAAHQPCEIKKTVTAVIEATAGATVAAHTSSQTPGAASAAAAPPCPALEPLISLYTRFITGPKATLMTPKEKAWLAVRNVADPFNGITILGFSAIYVGANSHSPYGPGMTGWAKDVGVSYSQDMTGEFFGTFLIPSIVHQDPHYHRMPDASIKRRIAHCIYQIAWTQSDYGKGMVNYADLGGFAIDDAIANLYVPGRQTSLPADAQRYGISLATAPIENFVDEFVPDVARHIHVRVVVIQQIINQVANKNGSGT